MIKIVTLADTHMEENKVEIPECDLLICAGDYDIRTFDHLEQLNNLFYIWKEKANHIIAIGGNHDFYLEKLNYHSACDILNCCTYLFNNSVEIKGLKIWGSPFSLPFYQWAFMKRETELAKIYAKIPNDTDIIISHSPPNGILDQVYYPNGTFKENTGSIALRDRIKEIKPKLVVCGHIHCARGIYQDEHTTYVNCSLMDDYYQLNNKPIVLEI